MRLWGIATVIALGVAATAMAGPLDLKQVSADAKWVVHFDVDAMRESTLVQRIYDKVVQAAPGAEQRLRQVTDLVEHLGMDLTRDLHGLTAYGMVVGKPDGVFLVDANVDQKSLLEKADQAPDHQATTHGAYQVHSWTDAKGKRHEHPMAGTFYKPNLLVFAPTAEQVNAALDVLDAKSPVLAGKECPLASKIPSGTLVLVRAVGLADAKLPWKSPLVTQSEMFGVSISEQGGKVCFQGKLIAKSKEMAEKAKSVVEGGRAMAELHHGQDAEAAKLIKALKVSVADVSLSVEFSAPADDVWAQLEKGIQRAIEHHKNRAERKDSKQ